MYMRPQEEESLLQEAYGESPPSHVWNAAIVALNDELTSLRSDVRIHKQQVDIVQAQVVQIRELCAYLFSWVDTQPASSRSSSNEPEIRKSDSSSHTDLAKAAATKAASAAKQTPHLGPAMARFPPPQPPPSSLLSAPTSSISPPASKKRMREDPTLSCAVCGTKETPRWRRGQDNKRVCNACGLLFRSREKRKEAIVHQAHHFLGNDSPRKRQNVPIQSLLND